MLCFQAHNEPVVQSSTVPGLGPNTLPDGAALPPHLVVQQDHGK